MLRVFTSQINDDKFGFLRSRCRVANIRQSGGQRRFFWTTNVIVFRSNWKQSHKFIGLVNQTSIFHSLFSDM